MERQPTPVSLLVDARGLYASGIGRYLREILSVVLKDPRFGRVTLIGRTNEVLRFSGDLDPVAELRIEEFDRPFYSPSAQIGWLQLRIAGRLDADVAFFPHYDGPLFLLPPRSVVTVQDLIHFKVPQAFPLAKRLAAGFLLRRVAGQAEGIIVTSDATRDDLIERLPSVAGKVMVIPLGVSDFFFGDPPLDDDRVLPYPYLLCVGNQKPHKNQVAAVEVLYRLADDYPSLRLVLAGKPLDGTELVRQRANELGIAERIVEEVNPTDERLHALYRHSEAVLFPSLYEGFGLPVLEAMAAEAPVIASNTSSIPSVAGESAILVDPYDHGAMAGAVIRMMGSDGERRGRIEAGRAHARGFTWAETSRRVVNQLLLRAGRSVVDPRDAEVSTGPSVG